MSSAKWTTGSTSRPLTPSAPAFIPAGTNVTNKVLDASFVTHTIPDISPDSGVVGLCAVPHDRAGKHDLGWHIADFLAFKALLCGETHSRAQTWLSQCDIAGIVKDNPDDYAHGKDRRLVDVAAAPSLYTDRNGISQKRDDDIKIEPSAEKLMDDFLTTLANKSIIARGKGLPLIIVICGLTTLEQDVFFGETNPRIRVTSGKMREILGEQIEAIVITPALFSAGWLVNPSFCRPPTRKLRADSTEFLARQFGATFAKDLVDHFLSWSCPFIDWDQLGKVEKDGLYPGPVRLSERQHIAIEAFKISIHNALAGRLSAGNRNHSFNFEVHGDDWQKLVGSRKHKPLSYFKQKWEKLGVSAAATMKEQRLEFLGGAFGGNKASQERHIKHLVNDSFSAWPGYWALPFGRSARAAFHMFLENGYPDYRECHEIFNIMEHRATSAVVADMTLRYFGIPKPYEERCRDWDEPRWIMESTDATHLAVNRLFGYISMHIPGVNVPPGVNPNSLSVIQRRLEVPVSYLAAAINNYTLFRSQSPQTTVKRVVDFFKEIKGRQTELLLKDFEMHNACSAWLSSIDLSIRPRSHFIPPEENSDAVDSPGKTSDLVLRPLSKVSMRLDSLSANLPSEMKELLPDVDTQLALQRLIRERDSLVMELLEAPENQLVKIKAKMAETQSLLTFMENLAREKGTKPKNNTYEPEKHAQAASPSIHQVTSSVHGRENTPWPLPAQQVRSPDNQLPPHLRGPLNKAVEQPNTRFHTQRASEELGKTIKGCPRWPSLSNSSNKATPSSRTQPIMQKEDKEKEQTNRWIPPHLRGLQHRDVKEAEPEAESEPDW
ncbi:uncharacterized protein F4812DRAFT_465817 [Daldinia caldariorum]|uniref:uncharacterized protein n=1 Tax=Daldinia caldariorum TaxID=326644 RepID=UPI002008D351|nr:uncharacterized protein F4812DRAFT_465817 [Daldinia caldariorum]KAI1466588.1 hypothetical protein F4812DRAFT_465817 [Daldinia caldariorum]